MSKKNGYVVSKIQYFDTFNLIYSHVKEEGCLHQDITKFI